MSVNSVIPKTRADLATLFTGEGVELGVATGAYSATILIRSSCSRLWSIDRWSDHHDAAEYVAASRRLIELGQGRCIPLRQTFSEALPFFADGSLSFAYIDGYAHTGQEGGETLEQWWSKLKPGGIFAGHDYHPRWRPTMDTVDRFVAKHRLKLQVTEPAANDPFPSWWVRKPGVTSEKARVPAMPQTGAFPVPGSCVLVGNGPSVLRGELGAVIDAHDEVVRFNHFRIGGFEKHTGIKTTLWSTCGNCLPQDPDMRPDRIVFRGEFSNPPYAPRELFRIPMALFQRLRKDIQARSQKPETSGLLPTSGLLVCAWLIEQGMSRVSLVGFDHFSKKESGMHHYWIPRSFSQPKEHDGDAEAAICAEWREQGRIAYLEAHA